MTLKDWARKEEPYKLAKQLGVTPSTIYYWITHNKLPRAKVMVKIHKLSGGKVTYKSMVENSAKNCR